MAIVINKKSGLQSKRDQDINKDDIVLEKDAIGNLPQSIIKRSGGGISPQGFSSLPTNQDVKNSLVLSAAENPKGKLNSASVNLRNEILKIRTAKLREAGKNGGLPNIPRELKLAKLAFAKLIVDEARGIKETPQTLRTIYKNPEIIKEIPKNISSSAANFGTLIKESPTEAIVQVAGQLLILKGTSKAIKLIGKGTRQLTRLSPKYLGTLKKGKTFSFLINGKKIKLKVIKKLPTQSIKKQLLLQGKTITPVSAQANKLFNILRRSRKIKKPIPTLPKYARKLIKKLDKGNITRKELVKLNIIVRRSGSKGILERSFFADPKGRVRLSRLGIDSEKEASFMDLLSEDIKFKRGKPQVLVFNKQKLANFPKSLKKINNKLKKGKTLTKSEANKLLSYQLKKSGKFKPLGFVNRESEITLSPNEIIARKRKLGVALYKGRRISIVQAEIKKPSLKLSKLIKKGKLGKLKNRELKQLKRLVKKETGIKLKYGSYAKKGKYFSLKRAVLSIGISGLNRYKFNKLSYGKSYKGYSYPTKRTYGGGSYPTKRTYGGGSYPTKRTYGGGSYPTKRTYGGGSFYKPPKSPPKTIIPPRTFKKLKNKIKLSQSVKAFNVYAKSGKRFIKLNKAPLRKRDALNRGAYAVDHSTSKTFKIVPTRKTKTLGVIRSQERNYFRRKGGKFRGVRISRGRKFKLMNKYIEKRRYGVDTYGEKRGLSLARLIKKMKYRR